MQLEKLLLNIFVMSNEDKLCTLSCFYDDDCGMNNVGIFKLSGTQKIFVLLLDKPIFISFTKYFKYYLFYINPIKWYCKTKILML